VRQLHQADLAQQMVPELCGLGRNLRAVSIVVAFLAAERAIAVVNGPIGFDSVPVPRGFGIGLRRSGLARRRRRRL
jgi:hypothetical protein